MQSNDQNNAPDSKKEVLQWVEKYLQSKKTISHKVIETLALDLENNYWSVVQSVQSYIWTKTWKSAHEITFWDIESIDRNTINEDVIPFKILTQDSVLTFDPQTQVTITDNNTGETRSGFPRKKWLNEDDEFSDEPSQEWITLTNSVWESKYFALSIINGEYCLDTTTYTIQQKHTKKSHSPLSEAILLHILKDHTIELETLTMRDVDNQTNILDNNATPLPHQVTDTETILQAWSHPRHTKNKKNTSPFSGYAFARATEIPDAVKKEMEARQITTPKARIYQWIISFNKDYFCEKYWLKDIRRKQTETWKQLVFVFPDGTNRTVWEMYADSKTKACITEMIATKTHEITHRLLHFNWIQALTVPTSVDWVKVTVDQEFLCEVADRISRPREKTENGSSFVRFHDGKQEHIIYCDALEEHIAKKIPWFTRQSIKWLDVKQLENYLEQCGRFDTLAATNSATIPIKNTNQIKRKDLQKNPNTVYLFWDNLQRQWMWWQAGEMRWEPNWFGIATKKYWSNDDTDVNQFFSDTELDDNKKTIDADIKKVYDAIDQWKTVSIPRDSKNNQWNLWTWLSELPTRAPHTFDYLQKELDKLAQYQQSKKTTKKNNDEEEEEEDTDTQHSPETMEHQNFLKEFVHVLGKDGSESWVECAVGTAIFLKDTISTIPWYGHNRVKYVLTGIWEDTISLRMEDATENNVAGSKVFTMPKTQETINKIAKIGKQSTILLKKTEKNNFTKKIGDFAGWQRSKIGSDFSKSYKDEWKTKTWPITHVWSIKGKITWLDKTENVIYKVERWYNKVTVSGQVNKKDISKNDKQKKELRTKQMDYDTFMVFCKSKWLLPYNEKEVKKAWMSVDPAKIPASDISRRDKLVSLWAVWNFLKAIPESVKKKVEEEQEFQAALAKDYFANWIPNVGIAYLDEIRGEIGGMDALVRQKIQKYKSDRTGGGEKSDVHDVPIFEWMRDALFISPSNRRNFKYKAASWLLYALEKWSLYPRALAPYANADWWWYWIKIILGDEMHKEFIKERQNKIDQWRSQWLNNDEGFYDRLVKYELEFIQQATTDKPFWWSKFWREVESHKDKLFWWADSIDPWGIAAKGNFDAMYEAFLWWGIKWNNPKTLFSALKAMEWAVETDNDLNLFYQCILLIFVTWIIHTLPTDYRNKLAWIWRAKWIPVTLFAWNTYASGEVVRLLDHIAKNAWMRSFSEYVGSSAEDFDNKHVGNYAEVVGTNDKWDPITAQQALTDHFKEWWASAWDVIISWFSPGENLLKTKTYPDWWAVPSKTKEVVSSYLGDGWIFNTYLWNQDDTYYKWVDAQTPIYQKNLMNLAKWPLKSILWLSWKNLQINADETTQQMRKNFVQIIWWYDNTLKSIDAETIEPMMSFLYGKYLQLFWDKLNAHFNKSTYKTNLENALLEWWDLWMNSLNTIVKKWIIWEKTKEQRRQQQLMNPDYEEIIFRADIWLPIAQDWIHAFSELLFKGMKWLSKEIKERIIKAGNKFSGSE